MYQTLLLEISGNVATITLNRPEKRNAISTPMMAELQTALDEIEKSHARVGILTGAGKAFCAGMDLDMLAAIAKQSPAENQEDSRRIAKLFRRIGLCRRLRYRNALRFHARRAGSEIRLHGSEDRFPAGNRFRVPDEADRGKTLPRFIANGPHPGSARSEGIWPRLGGRALDGARARTCKPADRRKPQQPDSFQTSSGLFGGGKRGSRFGTRHPGECAHSLHAGFPGGTGFVSGEAQAGLAGRETVTGFQFSVFSFQFSVLSR